MTPDESSAAAQGKALELEQVTAAGPVKSVHVLYLIDELCRRGGAEAALLRTTRWLSARGYRCSVITFRIDASLPMLAEFPCPVHLFPLRRTYDWNALSMAIRLSGFIAREEVDIVHTFFASADLWGGVVTKLSGRSPALISSRRDMGFLRTAKHRQAYRVLHPIFDRVLAVSGEVERYSIEQDGLDPAKVKTIYNAVDIPPAPSEAARREQRAKLGIPAGVAVIASVGNIRRIKGFDVLIRAAARVCQELPDSRFVIVGGTDPAEPKLTSELIELSTALGVERNVQFVGPLRDVTGLLQASDLFCLLSHTEGFSNALLEAMACGLPVVATRVGGNAEAVEQGAAGFLVQSGDHEAAAGQILTLLRDPLAARRMGAQARKTVARRFSPEAVMPQLVASYEEVLAERRLTRKVCR